MVPSDRLISHDLVVPDRVVWYTSHGLDDRVVHLDEFFGIARHIILVWLGDLPELG
jgi:hypothetical protein